MCGHRLGVRKKKGIVTSYSIYHFFINAYNFFAVIHHFYFCCPVVELYFMLTRDAIIPFIHVSCD